MTDTWKTAKYILLLLVMALGVLWGVALLYGFVDGSVSGIRVGIKLLMIAGLLVWLYDRWKLLSDK